MIKPCPLCSGKMLKRLYLMLDWGTSSEAKRTDYVCKDCGASLSNYNDLPMLFDPHGSFISAYRSESQIIPL